jgi:AmmeMemoRadiSam system protein A
MVKAYLVPHPPLLVKDVGKGNEIPDTRSALNEISAEIENYNPDTLIIISPHSVRYGDYIHIAPGKSASGSFANFGAGHVKFNIDYDDELSTLIGQTAETGGITAGSLGEKFPELDHGVMVPLAFLGTKRKIVRISLSGLSALEHYRLGIVIRKSAELLSRRIIIIASGDMSHKLKHDGPYGLSPEGAEFDKIMRECAENADFMKLLSINHNLCEKAAECGYMSFVMLAGCLDGMSVKSRVLCYEAPFGVGYLTASFGGETETPSLLPLLIEEAQKKINERRANEDIYVKLARLNIEEFVRTGKRIPLPNDLPQEMLNKQAGVFVSLKINNTLRGCIGTIAPTEANIAQEILKNSISAAAEDPRFEPVCVSELDSITYSVDVLGAPEPIDSPDSLDVIKYGVIVTHGYRRGLLLPNLDGVDTVEQQISITLQKAGINPSEPYTLERFEVIRHL